MPAQLPRVLHDMNLHVDGFGFAGRVTQIQLPTLAALTEEHHAGGMDNALDMEIGMQKPELSVTIRDMDPMLRRQLLSDRLRVVVRGAARAQGQAFEGVKITTFGLWKTMDSRTWERGSLNTETFTCQPLRYIEEQQGEELVHIDTLAHIRRIGGIDQLAEERGILGL